MWSKHTSAVEIFTFNFFTALETAETVSLPVVRVLRRVGLAWVDVTANFVDGTPTLLVDPLYPAEGATRLPWKAKAGTAATQPGKGTYAVYGEVTTSLARKIIWIEDLKIVDRAVVAA